MFLYLHVCSSLQSLADANAVARTWRQMLACASSCLRMARSELLREAVTEAMKNMLLVLSASQTLPADAWGETWAVVDVACPSLRADITPSLCMCPVVVLLCEVLTSVHSAANHPCSAARPCCKYGCPNFVHRCISSCSRICRTCGAPIIDVFRGNIETNFEVIVRKHCLLLLGLVFPLVNSVHIFPW